MGTNGIIYIIYVLVLASAIPLFIMAYRFLKKILGCFIEKKKVKEVLSDDIFKELDFTYLYKQY